MCHFTGIERVDHAIGVLDSTAETFQDENLTIKHYCLRRCPHYAATVQCKLPKQAATRRTTIWTARKNDVQRHVYQLLPCHSVRTTSVSSFDQHHSSLPISPLRLFTGGFRTFPSTKPPKLMTVLAVSSVTGTMMSYDTARYSRLAWECGRLAKLPSPPTYISPSSTRKLPLPSVPRCVRVNQLHLIPTQYLYGELEPR
ncbi:uncharacterized protein ARMOST_13612 [Armillaria ostoyae]|uniref:Uncharacterized protein n=1 Tax=Armillaria ostoyae TaxID=47428 RepID=A0A284RNA9_ARMOS|nr:uncharacterized protein ARMOST_13612 [Armillaria ostoyae]